MQGGHHTAFTDCDTVAGTEELYGKDPASALV